MSPIKVFVETGKKRTFVGAVDWPGWSRSGRDEAAAQHALVDYGPRYGQVLHKMDMDFQVPADASDLVVTERHEGNATTDFGAPAIVLDADKEPISRPEYERFQALLLACWQAFDHAVRLATGRELRKGPRGGGRELEAILDHLIESDRGYLARLAWRHKREGGRDLVDELSRTREATLDALGASVDGDLPERGPRTGVIWPPRYFVRRVAWHVLDHAWEIEDRAV